MQFITHASILVNTSAINEKPSVYATLDIFLLVTNLVVSNVLLLISIATLKSLYCPHGMLLFVIMTIPVRHLIAVGR